MFSRLMNQSTIYGRHEARLIRTSALKDDPRPGPVRVLSQLPGFSLLIPPYEPSASEPRVLMEPNLMGEMANFSEDTIFRRE